MSTLGIDKRTKIVITLGPASWDGARLRELISAGADVCRINCSHSDHAAIRKQVSRVRQAAARVGKPVAVLLDLQGPKIRTSAVAEPLKLDVGSTLTVVMDPLLPGTGTRVGTTYPEMADDVRPGDSVLFADGALAGEVVAIRRDVQPAEVDIRIDIPGKLGSHKGINLPGVRMSVPSLTEKDIADVEVGVGLGVDYIALSFVRSASDLLALRGRLRELNAKTPIIAKIEKPEALANLESILDACEGVMVARGDLGVEVPIETVPVHQKRILHAAAGRGKLTITATQMLDSMERNPRPTRAETTDVANAILDGTDAVMLSGETSVGDWPVEAVRTMSEIAQKVEASEFFHTSRVDQMPPMEGPAGIACRAACYASSEEGASRPMIVFTWSGASAQFVSKLRSRAPVYAMSPNADVVDRLALVWGVVPFHVPQVKSIDELVIEGEARLIHAGYVSRGDELIVLGGATPRQGTTSFVKLHTVGRN